MQIILHELNGNPVEQRAKDGYINGTNICRSCGKDISTWKRSKVAKELIATLESDLQITRGRLIYSNSGGQNKGTWIHPDLAVPLAMWANPKFAIQVSRWVQNWILANSALQKDKIQSEKIAKLEHRLEDLHQAVCVSIQRRAGVSYQDLENALQIHRGDLLDFIQVNKREISDLRQKHFQLAAKVERYLQASGSDLIEQQEQAVAQKRYRSQLNSLMREYFADDSEGCRQGWNMLYGELIAQTGFEVYAASQFWGCSPLDAVEIHGTMERLYYIASEFAVSTN